MNGMVVGGKASCTKIAVVANSLLVCYSSFWRF